MVTRPRRLTSIVAARRPVIVHGQARGDVSVALRDGLAEVAVADTGIEP